MAKFSTTAKQRSLIVRIVQAFNYLKQNDLIPVNIHEISEVSCLRLYKQFFQTYLKYNQDLYKLFFNFSPLFNLFVELMLAVFSLLSRISYSMSSTAL